MSDNQEENNEPLPYDEFGNKRSLFGNIKLLGIFWGIAYSGFALVCILWVNGHQLLIPYSLFILIASIFILAEANGHYLDNDDPLLNFINKYDGFSKHFEKVFLVGVIPIWVISFAILTNTISLCCVWIEAPTPTPTFTPLPTVTNTPTPLPPTPTFTPTDTPTDTPTPTPTFDNVSVRVSRSDGWYNPNESNAICYENTIRGASTLVPLAIVPIPAGTCEGQLISGMQNILGGTSYVRVRFYGQEAVSCLLIQANGFLACDVSINIANLAPLDQRSSDVEPNQIQSTLQAMLRDLGN